MSLKQKTNDIINEMDMDLKIAEEELTKDFDDEESEEMELDSLEDEEEEDKEIKRTRHGKPSPYASKNGRAPHLHHLYANYGGEVMPYINMFDLQLSYETSDIELLYHLCERINKMIDIINAENKYINRLTDWTEKKIHKLFKHQKKFENYLLELLDEFKEEMNEKFSEFKEEIKQEIKDFEDLVNEELTAMNEEINRFENEMKDRADAFEESMKERANAFESEMKERATAFETEVNNRLDSMDNEIASFENEMKLRADNFENSINNEMSTFETEMRNRASEFEETIEKEQSNYESEMNTRADNFETSVNKTINDFKTETTTEINEFESLVNSTINDFSSDWTTKLNDFETYINHHMEEFESDMDERADSFETDLKEEWNDFKDKFSQMYNEYITDISNQWNEFKNEMSEEWTSEKETLESEMASYEETMNANYNDFKESIENYISECCENVQNEINSFEETVNKLIDDFENDYNERLETTTKEEVDAKIEDIVNQSIYELIQQSEEFRNAISNVVNQLLEESETLKEMITDIVNNLLEESETLNEKIWKCINNYNISMEIKNATLYPYTFVATNLTPLYIYDVDNTVLATGFISTGLLKIQDIYATYNTIHTVSIPSLWSNIIRNGDQRVYLYKNNNNEYMYMTLLNDKLSLYDETNVFNKEIIYNDELITPSYLCFDNVNNKLYITDNENIYYSEYNNLRDLLNNDELNIYLYSYIASSNNIVGVIDNTYYATNEDMTHIYCYIRNTDNMLYDKLLRIPMDIKQYTVNMTINNSIIIDCHGIRMINYGSNYYYYFITDKELFNHSIDIDYNFIAETSNYWGYTTIQNGILTSYDSNGYYIDYEFANMVIYYLLYLYDNPTINIYLYSSQINLTAYLTLKNTIRLGTLNIKVSCIDNSSTPPNITIIDCPNINVCFEEGTFSKTDMYNSIVFCDIENINRLSINNFRDRLTEIYRLTEEDTSLGLYFSTNSQITNTEILINTRIILPVDYAPINNCLIICTDRINHLLTNPLTKLTPVTDNNLFNCIVFDVMNTETQAMWDLLCADSLLIQGGNSKIIKGE